MTEWSFETQMEAFQAISDGWAKWMSANKVQEVVVEIEAVGTRAKASSRVLRPRGLMRRPAWADNELPAELVHQAVALRGLDRILEGGIPCGIPQPFGQCDDGGQVVADAVVELGGDPRDRKSNV